MPKTKRSSKKEMMTAIKKKNTIAKNKKSGNTKKRTRSIKPGVNVRDFWRTTKPALNQATDEKTDNKPVSTSSIVSESLTPHIEIKDTIDPWETLASLPRVEESIDPWEILASLTRNEKSLIIGLTDSEIEKLLTKKEINTKNEKEEENYARLFQELARHLPDQRTIKKQPQKQQSLLVKHIESRHEHSPFVLNLRRALEEKQAMALKKSFVEQKIARLKNPLNISEKKAKRVIHILRKSPQKITDTEEKYLQRVLAENNFTLQPAISESEVSEQLTQATKFRLPALWYKPVIIFLALGLLAILPIKGFTFYKELLDNKDSIINTSSAAIEKLKSAGTALSKQDLRTAEENFSSARFDFEQAEKDLNGINVFLSETLKVIPFTGKYLTSAERLVQAGKTTTEIGSDITKIFADLYSADNRQPLTDKLEILKGNLDDTLLPKIKSLNSDLQKVDVSILPEDKQPIFTTTRNTLTQLQGALEELSNFATYLNEILGANGKKRYLIIFQNNNELRATGGFMGSLALIDVHHGAITKMEIPGGGPYDFQGSLTKQVVAPEPLHLVKAKWELQDANWFFDYPTSAQKIQWFLENSGSASVDGILAINSSLVEKILIHTNPIEMPEYNKTITAENFLLETQNAVEIEYDRETNKPKQFIADLTPKLLNQLLDSSKTDWVKIAQTLKNALEEKDIMLYFNDRDLEDKFMSYGWTGEIKNTNNDYLAVVNTNINGGKTDGAIEQTINHETRIDENGRIIDTLTITRHHTGGGDLPLSNIQNINYLRIYVPSGSRLISAEGFTQPDASLFKSPETAFATDTLLTETETNQATDNASQTKVYRELSKTVFANWTMTAPGATTVIKITYEIPYRLKFNDASIVKKILGVNNQNKLYSLFYQKQSGSQNTTLTSTLILPDKLQIIATTNNENTNTQTFNFERDHLLGYIIETK